MKKEMSEEQSERKYKISDIQYYIYLSTKKYYLWDFILGSKYHKVEMFHSRLTTKKKLCLDSQTLSEEKAYKNNFTYSFKVDKLHFNCIQTGDDSFELRIDNREFRILMEEERTGKLQAVEEESKEKQKSAKASSNDNKGSLSAFSGYKFEQVPSFLRSKGTANLRSSIEGDTEQQNNDYAGGSRINKPRSASVTGSYTNTIRSSNTVLNSQNNEKQSQKATPLLDLTDISNTNNSKSQAVDQKTILSQINFSASNEIYEQNQNVLNKFDIFQDEGFKQEDLFISSQPATNNFNLISNQNSMNINASSTNNPMAFFQASKQQNSVELSSPGFKIGNSSDFTRSTSDNINSQLIFNKRSSMPILSGSSLIEMNTNMNEKVNPRGIMGIPQSDGNQLKKNIASSGLVNLDNILEDTKKSKVQSNAQVDASNYNFSLGNVSAQGPMGYGNTSYGYPYPMGTNPYMNMNMNMNVNPYYQMSNNQNAQMNTNTMINYQNPTAVWGNNSLQNSTSSTNKNISTKKSTPFDL